MWRNVICSRSLALPGHPCRVSLVTEGYVPVPMVIASHPSLLPNLDTLKGQESVCYTYTHLELGGPFDSTRGVRPALLPAYNPALSFLMKARIVWLSEAVDRKG